MSSTAAASASASATLPPGSNGRCGSQYGRCLTAPVPLCCSVNGYCGSDETYCLPINNCQPDFGYCVGASDSSSSLLGTPTTILSANGTSTSTPTSLHTTTTLQSANSSTTHSASATAAHHGLSSGARKGVIAGATVGAIAILLLIIGIFLLLSRKRGRNTSGRTPLAVVEQRQEPDGPYNKGLNALSGTRVWEHGEI